MKKNDLKSLSITIVIIILASLFALAGSQGGSKIGGIPVFSLAVGLIFLIQWVAFIPAYLKQTEKFYDLTGSLTYISVTLLAFLLTPGVDFRATLLMVLVLIWAGRLGTFLFRRVKKAGKDDRFDEIKPNFFRFLNVWTIQALWITFTASAALVAITTTLRKDLDFFAIAGLLVWILGFAFEAVSDAQKSRFNANPENKGKFIQTGLWSRSRHPNYFGEIVLWIGVLIITLPVLQGWQWVALISPIFVGLLITRVSGVPLLEKKADKKWGGQVEYESYKMNTPVLIPRVK
jgi:steroid 5-alpha reductase family enzyme